MFRRHHASATMQVGNLAAALHAHDTNEPKCKRHSPCVAGVIPCTPYLCYFTEWWSSYYLLQGSESPVRALPLPADQVTHREVVQRTSHKSVNAGMHIGTGSHACMCLPPVAAQSCYMQPTCALVPLWCVKTKHQHQSVIAH
jgi:hypothetical protein